MTENGLFLLGGPETQLHDILLAVHDGKNHGRSGAAKISVSSWLRWVVGSSDAQRDYTFLSYTYVRVCEALGSN